MHPKQQLQKIKINDVHSFPVYIFE